MDSFWLVIMCFYSSILEHIKAIRRNIEVELKELLKLCGWERSESLLSIKNSKSTRNKLRDLIEKYNVSNMWSIGLSLMLWDELLLDW